MEDRGPRTVEYIEAMRSIWNDEEPEYEGELFRTQGPCQIGTFARCAHHRVACCYGKRN